MTMRPIEDAPEDIRDAYRLSLNVDAARGVMLLKKSYWATWSFLRSKREMDEAVQRNRATFRIVT